ncbi:MAG: nitrile hydratase subunit alpha, partial [Rhizobiales bacterium]|nr:nitrile hydratase subunit alpha [Hyphomicrobiales bacterium]
MSALLARRCDRSTRLRHQAYYPAITANHHDDHHHGHHHDHDHSELSETELRVRALETILTQKGYVDPAALDVLIETYETKVGPRNGAQVVAKAWTDPAYRERLLADGSAAIAELDYVGRQGEHIVVVENT